MQFTNFLKDILLGNSKWIEGSLFSSPPNLWEKWIKSEEIISEQSYNTHATLNELNI